MKEILRYGLVLAFISLGIASICAGCSSSNLSIDDYLVREPKMSGHLQSIKTTTYCFDTEFIGDSAVKGDIEVFGTDLDIYNKEGKLLERWVYFPAGVLWHKWVYRYDEKGVLKEGDYIHNNKVIAKEIYQFNDKGKVTRIEFYQPPDSLYEYSVWRYDPKGRVVEIEAALGKPWGNRYTYEYLGKGNTVKEHTYEADGKLDSFALYQIEKKGRIVSYTSYNPDGSIRYRRSATYDKRGNELESRSLNDNTSDTSPSDSDTTAWKISIEISLTDKNSYTYDRKGNWIRQVISAKGDTVFIKEREIKYYK